MAIDAGMLGLGCRTGQALWRVYGWSEPAMTFGYSQRWGWVQLQAGGFAGSLIRRSTGGGIVDHRADLTYSLTLPPRHRLFRRPARQIYEQLHRNLANAVMELGHLAALAECDTPCSESPNRGPGICFEAPEPFDVVHPLSGVKLAGAAMRRSREGILIQGSLNIRHWTDFSRIRFTETFAPLLAIWLQAELKPFRGELPGELLKKELKRYSSEAWNRKR